MTGLSAERKIIKQLEERIAALEKRLSLQPRSLSRGFCQVEQLYVERLIADKVEINLDSLDIDELSGILNIGQSFGSTVVRRPVGREAARRAIAPLKAGPNQSKPQIRIKYEVPPDRAD